MARIVLHRLATSIVTVFITTVLVFALRYLFPGGPIQAMLGGSGAGQVTAKQLGAIKARLGLNVPVPDQYWHWLLNALHGNFGTSYYSQQPVMQVLRPRFVPSLELIVGSLGVSIVVGGGIGVLAAIMHHRRLGRAIVLATGLGLSVPDFWLATLAAGFLGLTWRIFPAVGYTPISQGFLSNIHSIILPVLVLSVVVGSILARHVSSAMTAALNSPYIRTAWAMGLPRRKVYLSCALRNAVGPVITFIPLAFAALVGGTVPVEHVFNIPGLGSEILSSVTNEDFPVVQAIVLIVGVIVALLNLGADVAMVAIDPRVRSAISE